MARKTREKVIEELKKLEPPIEFEEDAGYEELCDLLKANSEQENKSGPEPLSDLEKVRMKELERMASMGRNIDQPTPAEMIELGKLRQRAKA